MAVEWFRKADFLQGLFDAVPSPILLVGRDLRVIFQNSAAIDFTQGGDQVLMSQKSGDLLKCLHSLEEGGCGCSVHCRDCVIRRSVGKAFKGERVSRETTKLHLMKDGESREVHFQVTAAPMRYKKRILVLLILEDITGQKAIETALRRHAGQLETAYRDLDSFSYSAAHDLRSPIVRIGAFGRALLEDHAGDLDPEGRRMLDIIVKNAALMEQLLHGLLSFSRISTLDVRQNEVKVDLEALARDVREELQPPSAGRQVRFRINPMPSCRGDRLMLRQVFFNLLSNALKYTRQSEEAVIEVGGREEGGSTVYYVRDNGTGFDMKYVDRLFGLFSRLHPSDQYEGTGVGLAIVRRIIEKHGGRVWAEGRPGEGSTFYLRIPGD